MAEALSRKVLESVKQCLTQKSVVAKNTASVGLRLNKRLEKEIDEVKKEEAVDKSTAVRMLVDAGYKEWKFRRALDRLRANKVTLWEAARIAGIPLWDFVALLKKEEGIEWAEFNPKDQLAPKRRH